MAELGSSDWHDLPIDDAFTYGTRFALSDTFDSEEFRGSVIRFDPGEGGPLHYHEPPVEEIYMVLEGKLDIQLGDEIVEADAGTVLFTPSGNRHQPRNNYDEPAVLLSILAPLESYLEDGVTIVEEPDE